MNEKISELKQRAAGLADEAATIIARADKEKRSLTADEDAAHENIYGRLMELRKQISARERQLAMEGIGPDSPEKRASAPLPHQDPANVGRRHQYSLLRAARCLMQKQPVDGLEGEVSRELEKRTNKLAQGFLMPYRTSGPLGDAEKRALDSTAGTGSVPTVLSKDWIELLRNRLVVRQAGATVIEDLQGKFAIPRQNAAASFYWVAESGAPTGSNQTLDQVQFSPKTGGAFTDISRRFFELSMIESGEEFVRNDLTAIIARGIDQAALNGTGASNQPLGILQNTAITSGRTVSLGTNGGAPTWQALVEQHTIVARGNAAQLGGTAYVGNADVTGTLGTTAKIGSTFPVFLLDDNGQVYRKPYYETQMIPNTLTKGTGTGLSALIYGVWSQLILAYWSGIDVLVDPYTGSSSGTVRIVALQDMDLQVRHPEAFSVITDLASNQTQ